MRTSRPPQHSAPAPLNQVYICNSVFCDIDCVGMFGMCNSCATHDATSSCTPLADEGHASCEMLVQHLIVLVLKHLPTHGHVSISLYIFIFISLYMYPVSPPPTLSLSLSLSHSVSHSLSPSLPPSDSLLLSLSFTQELQDPQNPPTHPSTNTPARPADPRGKEWQRK